MATDGVEILTARLTLRRARPDDLEALHAILSDPRATRWWSTPPHESLGQTRAWLDAMIGSPAEISEDFVIEQDDRLIGKAGFFRLPEIGVILHPDAWGRGLAHEALAAVIDRVFAKQDFKTLVADVDPANSASIRLLERLGFRQRGSARATQKVGDQWADSLYYRLDRPDVSLHPET